MGIHKYRNKLALILIMMIGFTLIVSGIIAANRIRQWQMESLEQSMERDIRMILSTIPWKTEGTWEERVGYFTAQAGMLKEQTGLRVTFIDPEGRVLGDSDAEASQMGNHLNRPEIRDALETGKTGTSVRTSSTVNEELIYVAAPLYDGDTLKGLVRLSTPLDEAKSHIRQMWSHLFAAFILLFFAASIISYRAALELTRPLDKIMRVANQIAQKNYKTRVDRLPKDELGQLGKAINKMASSLEQQVERLQENEARLKSVLDNMNVGVLMIDKEERIVLVNPSAEEMLGFTHRELYGRKYDRAKQPIELTRLIEESLKQRAFIRDEIVLYFPNERIIEVNLVPMSARDGEWGGILVALHDITDLRRLEKVRSEFVANVSHELKTPVAALKGFAETLLAGAIDDRETARSFLQIIHDESERLNRLIMDILELSKIESKRIPLNFSPVHLSEFVGQTLEMMKSEAQKKQISLSMEVPESLYLEADEDRLRQILINLLSNGISYTPNGGSVKVTAETIQDGENEKVRISVKDTGIGIPKSDLPRIFERFYRVDKARSRSSGGTGLGLSIVKHLVELHKGTIHVESRQGLGSTFMIDLPVIQE